MRTVPDSSVPADRESAQAHGRWIRVVELPRIELGSGLLSAFACCHVRRFIPTCVGEDHPWTGAFGEPARLVDDVHVLVGRIHRPTVRPVRFKFSGFDPLIGNGIKVGFHATRVKREEETVLASILVARLMTVVLTGLRHVANGFRQAIESLSAPLTSSRCFSTGIPSAERASVPPVGFALP